MATKAVDTQLHRGLKNRHVQMIAIGGAIGTGLFYGSAFAIQLAGPSVLIANLICGGIIFLMLRSLGEMATADPGPGSFTYFAYKYWGNLPGFFTGWNYWFAYSVAVMAELSVVGIYVNFWWPDVPLWLTGLVGLALLTALNIATVRIFGESEFWFAGIKVATILFFIIFGLSMVLFGVGNDGDPLGLTNLFADGGFMPNGIGGLLLSVAVVMFSFGGVEMVGIAAAETEDPGKTIPKAVNGVVWRILVFYVGAIGVILLVVPWSTIGLEGSPFVQVFTAVGIPAAASIVNAVVLTAAMSAMNSGLYSIGRMLHGLALQGNAPKALARVSKSGLPTRAILTSVIVIGIGLLGALTIPGNPFLTLASVTLFSAIVTWLIILRTQVHFRRAIGPDAVSKLTFKMPWYPYSNIFAAICFLGVIVAMYFLPPFQSALIFGPIWAVLLLIAYAIKRKVAPNAESLISVDRQGSAPAAAESDDDDRRVPVVGS
ncbi:amino acid permease [Microbacterium sp. SSM24]|uniref:amino acid permease n=1 Tax=Microbacterium sp. SSM24 TaxID=2991714 RepID=UPI0022279E21|nr:amino acid permease [Microbacterium sp. SSM24]MCW3492620.1 amino acid permease [Microbacterium sp. SSM24]